MKELHLNIVSPEKEVFNGEVKSVTLPGTSGVFSILPQHAPDRKSTRLNSSHIQKSRMPSSA